MLLPFYAEEQAVDQEAITVRYTIAEDFRGGFLRTLVRLIKFW